jgi:hypothetical protein
MGILRSSVGIITSIIFVLFGASTAWAAPSAVSLVVMPHPDDESEAWSLIENSSANYKVFTYLTRGEETAYCINSSFTNALVTDKGEVHPGHTPGGKWAIGCHENRIASTINFLNMMAAHDSSLPKGFSISNYTTVTLPANGANPQHIDNGIAYNDRTVRIYNSTNGMGKVLFFNLGDRDLTTSEVAWAIKAIKTNPAAIGIPTNLPFYNAIGPYANTIYSDCVVYAHPDHKAIHTALYGTDFSFTGYQTAATCQTDPDTHRTVSVTATSWNRAWGMGTANQRTGYAQKYYGWLDSATNGWAVASGASQNQVMMQKQSFWQRF